MSATPSRAQLPSRARLSRRSLLAAGASGGLVALAACDPLSAIDPPSRTGSASGSPEPQGVPSLRPDVALATLALAEISAVRHAVTRTQRRFPRRTGELGAVVSMHRTHESALADAVPEGAEPATQPPAYAVPADAALALQRLRVREEQLLARLDSLAVDAESGSFAGLLASMGAGVAQRVATWPR